MSAPIPVRARVLTLVLATGAVLAAASLTAEPAAAIDGSPCRDRGARGLLCTTIPVARDRTGERRGTLRLEVAFSRRTRSTGDRWVLALSGGPGQSSLPGATSFRRALAPLLRSSRLVILDQRGTGRGALRCPALQRLGGMDTIGPEAVGSCARRLGPGRQDFATADTVADIEAVRTRLGASRLTLMGISYGTFVAVQYARTHPDRVDRLVLDSPIGPRGLDPFLIDSYARMSRVAGSWCANRACPHSAGAPWRSIARVAERLRGGPLTARIFGPTGRPRRVTLRDDTQFALLIGGADTNPAMQALLPGALASAAAGRPRPLLRLVEVAGGGAGSSGELSAALNATTLCADVRLPYSLDDPFASRDRSIAAALAAIPPALYAPFSRRSVGSGSIAADCSRWPAGDRFGSPSSAPLPDVPALILSGSLDLRTPLENGVALAAQLPRASRVVLPGAGHDTIDTDESGCIAEALRRFAAGRRVGSPCRDVRAALPVTGAPPATLERTAPAPGIARRDDARVVGAVAATLADAVLQGTALLYAGQPGAPRAGGLNGGVLIAGRTLTLRRYALVPGVRVSSRGDGYAISLPGGRGASLSLGADGYLSGTVDGRRVRSRPPSLGAAAGAASNNTTVLVPAWGPARARALRAAGALSAGG